MDPSTPNKQPCGSHMGTGQDQRSVRHPLSEIIIRCVARMAGVASPQKANSDPICETDVEQWEYP